MLNQREWMKNITQLLPFLFCLLPFLTTQNTSASPLLHPTFYPLQHHRLAFLLLTHLCVCVCVHESNSTTLPLLPGLIIVLRRALPFSIWYPWQHILPWRAVCLRWSLSPTHSSLFPFPLHYSLRNRLPRFFFSAFSLHFLHRPCYPKHVTLLRSLYISLRTPYFLCIFSADLLLCHLSLRYTGPSYMSQMKSLYTFTSWPFTVEVYWVSLNWPIHQCALLYVCFLLLSCAKSRNHTEHPVISLRVPDYVELLNALYTYTNQNEGY